MAAGALLPEAVADLAALPDDTIERAMAGPIATRERILAERDLVTLERWHERAILAAGAADWLDDPSSASPVRAGHAASSPMPRE